MKTKIIIIIGCLFSLFAPLMYAQEIKITGTVLDEMNEGLPGASVAVKGTTTGTITDFDGNFSSWHKERIGYLFYWISNKRNCCW